MSFDVERLYQLLPAFCRIRDIELGKQLLTPQDREKVKQLKEKLKSLPDPDSEEARQIRRQLDEIKRGPLKALIDVIAQQAQVMEADIAQLYENWFIETCEDWVVPYIGDLLSVRGLHSDSAEAVFSQRARVANTLAYRRRKGTATVLEQLAYDTTGWRARAVEFFELLGTTQHYNHVRLHNLRTPDLRRTNELELLDTAFDKIAHTADVRHIGNDRGHHNIPNIGIFLWRLQSYPVKRSTAYSANGTLAGCYTFSPLGYDTPLFNRLQAETEITHLAEEINVPGLLRRRPLHDELEARRQAVVDGETPKYTYFDDRQNKNPQPVFEIFLDGSSTAVPSEEILICNLDKWRLPPDKKEYGRLKTGELVELPIKVAVDPVKGRLAFPKGVEPKQVQVSYAYGFSGDVGGGPYNRRASVDPVLSGEVDWQVGVSNEVKAVPGEIFAAVAEAVKEWNLKSASPDVKVGVIALMDSCSYKEGNIEINIPEGKQLVIVAADGREEDEPGGSSEEKHRLLRGQLHPNELRPHLLGSLEVKGTEAKNSDTPGQLVLDGLLVEGNLSVLPGNLGSLRVAHCTLVPERGGLKVESRNERLKIDLVRSICGPITLTAAVSKLVVKESIIDNAGGQAINAEKTPLELQKSTVFGEIVGLSIEASDCIFTEKIEMMRRQEGCVRFSYIPEESKTPRRFRCQPDLEISRQVSEAKEQGDISQTEEDIKKAILEWLVPAFTSTEYGHHAYAQLSRSCPLLIRTGAEDGSEMGVFSFLKQPQRLASLRTCIDQYLRFGLEAGLIFVTYLPGENNSIEEVNS